MFTLFSIIFNLFNWENRNNNNKVVSLIAGSEFILIGYIKKIE